MLKKSARDYLIELYDDYRNNYLTLEKFAEHNGMYVREAGKLIQIAQEMIERGHPDA